MTQPPETPEQMAETLGEIAACCVGDEPIVLDQGDIDALRAGAAALRAQSAVHAKFGFVEGPDGKCACAYCVGDAEALAEACADYEMKNHTLTQQLAALRAQGRETDELLRRLLVDCDSELSAIAHGRGFDKAELIRLSNECRRRYNCTSRAR